MQWLMQWLMQQGSCHKWRGYPVQTPTSLRFAGLRGGRLISLAE